MYRQVIVTLECYDIISYLSCCDLLQCPISTRGGMLDFDGEYQTFLNKGAAVRQNTSGIGAFFVNIHVIPVPPNSSHSLCDNINSPDLLATFAALFNNHDDGSVVYSYNETFQQKNIKLKVRAGLDSKLVIVHHQV